MTKMTKMDKNVKTNDNYRQICVWPGTLVGVDHVDKFVQFMKDEFNTRIQYLEEIETFPDTDDNGHSVEGTGGRNDVFFAVHCDDVCHFAVARLMYGIRWIEDVLADVNYRSQIYPERVFNYVSWNKEHISQFSQSVN